MTFAEIFSTDREHASMSFWSWILSCKDFIISLYIMQSIANNLVCEEPASERSLIYNKNSNGPNTVPWGTPEVTEAWDGVAPPNKTFWCLWVRKVSIQLRKLLSMPMFSSLLINHWWETVSNALIKSKITKPFWLFLSKIWAWSSMSPASRVSEDLPRPKPCWLLVNTWCWSRWFIMCDAV